MTVTPKPGEAPTTIHTPAEGLEQGDFDLATFDGTIKAYYATPAGQSNVPVILVIQEIFGVNEHVRDICRRFAKEGYLAVAAELYQRQGDPSPYTDIPKLIGEIVSKVPDQQVMADLDACVRWAAIRGANVAQLGVTGFCWGGRLTWMYASHNPACKAAVAWYGKLATGHGPLQTRNPVDIAAEVHAPVLGLYGAQDASIPVDDVRRVEGILAQGNEAARASQMVVYPESGHAFFADYRPSYRAQDAKDAWARALEWFRKYLA
jgi:carboxymethylenebutenolidase